MKNDKRPETGKTRRKAGFWAFCALLSAIGGCVLIILMGRHAPNAYQPASPANPQQVSPYLTHKLGPEFFNQMQMDEPFVLEIDQDGLNDILSRLPWPQPAGADATFSKPAVIFGKDVIYLMGTLEYKGVASVVTLRSEPFITPEGLIGLNVKSIRLGMLPVTKVAGKLAQQVFTDNLTAFEGEPRAEAQVRAIVENKPFEPVFAISGRSIKIRDFSLKTGLLRLTCEPVTPKNPDRTASAARFL